MYIYINTQPLQSELYHHGTKGQKWGVRRYQNPDGSLTDEGRRRYGYGKGAGKMMTDNTKEWTKNSAKLGAKVGATLGGIGGASTAVALIGMGLSAPVAISAGVGYMAGRTVRTAALSALAGAAVGASETHKGRKYIERYDTGLKDFEMRELKKK